MMIFAPHSPNAQSGSATPPGESAGGSGYKVVFVLTAFVIMRRFLTHVFSKSINARCFLAAGLIVTGPNLSAAVEQKTLSPGQFTALASGRVLTGEYPDGKAFNEKFIDQENTIYTEGDIRIPGNVAAKNNFVCFSYSTESDLVGGCFEIWQRSANCFDFYGTGGDDRSTVASDHQKRLSLAWSARGWMADKPSTCVSAQIS